MRATMQVRTLACAALCACAAPSDAVVCSTGQMVGTSEGPTMAPGHACNACHEFTNAGGDGMEAPVFAAAGTVYETAHEPNDCAGGPVDAAGETAEVEIVSANGEHHVAEVNPGGNFMLESVKLVFPITAGVRYRGRVRWMVTRQETGECNMCHSVDGSGGAPGRIQLP